VKNKKHDKILRQRKKAKEDHLESLADKLLEKQKLLNILKEKKIKGNFLDLF
jgi:hypothetical protein